MLNLVACGSSPEIDKSSVSLKEAEKSQEMITSSISSQPTSKDLKCTIAIIPGLAESLDKGAFVDLAKAIAQVYKEDTGGTITLELKPFARSIDDVVTGKSDFHIPNMKNTMIDQSTLPFNSSTKAFGNLYQVIYSNIDNKITKKMLDDAIEAAKKGQPFPYKIEVAGGNEPNYPFVSFPTNDYGQSFKKLETKRIDAILGAQEECDLVVRQLKSKTVFRAEWAHMQDVITIAKNAHGAEVDKIVSACLEKLEASGKLKELYSKIHSPYDDWQPAAMGW
jgi:polar amino acid transport system substrate-binding protein